MQRHVWILTVLLSLVVALAGCNMPGSQATGQAEAEEVLEPLEADAWPTPEPTAVMASPTPFPKITLEPTPTRTARPPVVATPTPLSVGGVTYEGSVEDLKEQVTATSGGFEPVAAFLVTAAEVTVRQGPAASYPALGVVTQGELGAVLGQNAAGDWLYVLTISVLQGWVPADTIRVMGTLDQAPVLPDNPLTSQPAPGASSSPGTAASQPLAIADLEAVATGQVDNHSLNLRQGPGAGYGVLATLSRGDEVSVLALNKTHDWVLVETADGVFGWVSLAYVLVDGSLADVPILISARPDADLPSGQIAPISGAAVSGGMGQGTAAAPSQGAAAAQDTPASPAPKPPGEPAPFWFDLSPVATARPSQGEVDLYRGPGDTYEPIATARDDDTVSVLAVNQEGDWALVRPADGTPGWASLKHLVVDGSLEDAPQAMTARVDSNEMPVREGPGLYYAQSGTLALNDMVVVLGANQDGRWALVTPVAGGGHGWIPFHFVTLSGSWDDVPPVPAWYWPQETPTDGGQPALTVAQTGVESPGVIVFQTSSGGDVMVINEDGTGLRHLTQGIDPVLSPDGQTVAFTRWQNGGEQSALWVINVDGSGEEAILEEMRKAKGPDWSPDGTRIVLNFQDGGRLEEKTVCQLMIDLATGERVTPNIPANARDLKFKMQDGLPYLCWDLPPDAHWSLRVVNVADGSFQDLYGGTYAFRPVWDPANVWRVLADSGYGLVETDVSRDFSQGITDELGEGSPAVSPDGRHIATAVAHGGTYEIHRLNSDGSGRVRLTKTPLWVTAGPGDQNAWNNVAPVWSPDGTRIAFVTDRAGRWEIWTMNTDGSDQRSMFSDDISDQIQIAYDFKDERVLSWR